MTEDRFEPATHPSPPSPAAISAGGDDAPTSAWPDRSRTGIGGWIAQGLRSALLLSPRVRGAPAPWQLLVVMLIATVLTHGVARLYIDGPARLNWAALLNGLWSPIFTVWLGWWTLTGVAPSDGEAQRSSGGRLSSWFALSVWTSVPATLLMLALAIGYQRGWLPKLLTTSTGFWTVYGLFVAWLLIGQIRLTARFAASRLRLALFVPGLAAIVGLGVWQASQGQDQVWEPDHRASSEPPRPRLELSQALFETQQAVWQRAVADIAPRRAGDEPNVYGLVFAPYAPEDVFLRESTMVAGLLEDRFDARGRVLHLVNHVGTAQDKPWATTLNLKRAVQALAERMDRDKDVLVIYLTSHGARDFRLAASHWPLSVEGLTPGDLREALDGAGVRHRVIAISACFSGGWIEPLANDDSLVMTAADATHTSYGCGRLSELTFFGRALFDEQLRKTHSFETAFAAALPVIQQREIEAGKDDGFSNPQLRIGDNVRPVLQWLAQRLGDKQP